MRMPRYLSPSQIGLWERDRDEYYLAHLAEVRAPKFLQTQAMSIGASFDAYVKAALYANLFGVKTNPQFEFETIFESQVDEHNRDWALEHGKYVFECYRQCGAYDDLLALLQLSKQSPQFEFIIEGTTAGVPMLGKPDLRFIHPDGAHVILDWKVNGYCSKYATSPAKNYRLVRDTWGEKVAKPSRGANSPHKNYKLIIWKGIEIHAGWLEEANSSWASQLAMYSWMLGEGVGDENVIVCIDQIIAKPVTPQPLLRVANHRARISKEYQQALLARLQACWGAIKEGHIFDDIPREESDSRCAVLERQAEAMYSTSPSQQVINEVLNMQRGSYR